MSLDDLIFDDLTERFGDIEDDDAYDASDYEDTPEDDE